MRYRSRSAVVLFMALSSVLAVAACTGGGGEITAEDITRAKEALGPFKKGLMGALTTAMKEEGPEHAISVCKLKAPEIASATSTDGVEIGRTSHRLRNPKNAPEPWMESFLQEYLANPTKSGHKAQRLADGRIGYVEPIRVKGFCLVCHGEEISSEVGESLKELYPEDQATGFRAGDFRGIFWVKMK